MNGRFLINRSDGKIMGVAAGLADYTGIDPTIIRLGFIAMTLLTGPVMILFYVLAGLLAPAYLKHPILGPRLRECVAALQWWAGERSAEEIFGSVDLMKLKSSLTLFD